MVDAHTEIDDEDAEFFSRMPPEFFEELERRAKLAMSQPGIPIAESRRRFRERCAERKQSRDKQA